MTQTININENEDNHSFHSRSSKSNYSLQGKIVEKVRKNSYNDIAFPVETELLTEDKNKVSEDKNTNELIFEEVLLKEQNCQFVNKRYRIKIGYKK